MRLSYAFRARVMQSNGIERVGGGGRCDLRFVKAAIDSRKGFDAVMAAHRQRKRESAYRKRIDDDTALALAAARHAAAIQ